MYIAPRGLRSDQSAREIRVTVTRPDGGAGMLEGFRFLWASYVAGFRADRHCQACFLGRRVKEFGAGTKAMSFDAMDRYPYLYICGVAAGPRSFRKDRNLHLPLAYEEGAAVERVTWTGFRLVVENARELPIPELPDGWGGLGPEFTRCKNFRFGVGYFGG